MFKKIALFVLCLALTLALAGCATVNGDNSFQGQPGEANQTVQQNEQVNTEPTQEPTSNPNEAGFNG